MIILEGIIMIILEGIIIIILEGIIIIILEGIIMIILDGIIIIILEGIIIIILEGIIMIILEGIDSINVLHRQCLLPPRFSQEFLNVSNFPSQLLTVQNITNYAPRGNKHRMLRDSYKK